MEVPVSPSWIPLRLLLVFPVLSWVPTWIPIPEVVKVPVSLFWIPPWLLLILPVSSWVPLWIPLPEVVEMSVSFPWISLQPLLAFPAPKSREQQDPQNPLKSSQVSLPSPGSWFWERAVL